MAHVPRMYHAGPLGPGPLALDGDIGKRLVGDIGKRLVGVMRIGLGEDFLLFSGDGKEWRATVTAVNRSGLSAMVHEMCRQAPPPAVVLETWVGVIRANRFEMALEKCVEAGADIVRLLVGEFSQRGDEASTNKLDRWQRIIIEATEQSGRLYVPVLEPPVRLPRLLDTYRGGLVMAEQTGSGAESISGLLPSSGHLALAVGPEGGFSPPEVAELKRRGAIALSLGPYILRSETAAIAGTALLRSLTG